MSESISTHESLSFTGRDFVVGVGHLCIDALLVFLLWNHALVGSVDGINKINFLTAFGIIFLARSISRG